MDNEILRMEHITKIYSNGTIANHDVNFIVREGEIHALMGENGAGKSTLMKILFGDEEKTEGRVFFRGKEVNPRNASEMIQRGVGMVHQHFMLVNSLRVYENVILGMEPVRHILIDKEEAIRLVNETAEKYNLNVDPMAIVGDLSVGLKQKVEILKVLLRGAKLLILDEPTAVLTPQETQELFEQLMLLKKSGHTIIFISHKIKEVMQICDNITVLRDGRTVGTMPVANATEEDISRFMVGREVMLKVRKKAQSFGSTVLEVRNLSCIKDGRKLIDRVSFTLHAGQILGIAGVEGNGQNEVVETIFGFYKNASGEVIYKGENILGRSIRFIRNKGISYIPEDRIKTGVSLDNTVWANLIADEIDSPRFRSYDMIDYKKIHRYAADLITKFQILCREDSEPVGSLSGGNMQKVVVAREFSSDPDLLIANQPTRGIDVGANEFIWNKLLELRDQGKAIILVSADLNEIMELSDSIMVMCDGRRTAFFEDADTVTEYELGKYMLGIPVLGDIVSGHNLITYLGWILTILLTVFFWRTAPGLRIRAVGENEAAAKSVGINIAKYKIMSLTIAGALAGIGGAYMSMGYVSFFSRDMIAGRGWIGMAAEAMGRGLPGPIMLAVLIFGMADCLAIRLQMLNLPSQLIQCIPYLVTIIAIAVYSYTAEQRKNSISKSGIAEGKSESNVAEIKTKC